MLATVPPHPVADKVAGIISRRLAPEYAKHGARLRSVDCIRRSGDTFDCRLVVTRGRASQCVEAMFQWSYVRPTSIAVDPQTMRLCPTGPPA